MATGQKKVSVLNPAFWSRRLSLITRPDWVFRAVWATTVEEWAEVLQTHKRIVEYELDITPRTPGNMRNLLDAGCGQGHLVSILPTDYTLNYTGVDLSPDFIGMCKASYPTMVDNFMVGDLRNLPFANQQFDIAICRSVEGMIINRVGIAVWRMMEEELLRVSKRVVFLNYTYPETYRTTELHHVGEPEKLNKYLEQQYITP
jgi:SAM-dependent methyltransferase